MKKLAISVLATFILIVLSACSNYFDTGNLQNAGMLVESSIHDQPWDRKGYEGLLAIEEEFDIDVFYKEGVKSEHDVREAVDELVDDGVNLIFGHSSSYGQFFEEISASYPDVHFVYFNGGQFAEDVTSLNFNSHAMGFFAGMMAGEMTETNHVGVIGAFEWQPEIEGFFEGVTYQNSEAEVHFNYVNDWNGERKAMQMYDTMRDDGADVIYPAGNAYSNTVIEQARADGIYAIGYVADQSEIAEDTVLTSTIQHVEKLYILAADNFNEGDLRGGVTTYDFQDDMISLGEFNADVPDEFQQVMNEEVEAYKNTGLLPHEMEEE
ncbi:BMP family ABC transporter substrate-binding protein [Lentibacillus sp. CBA3610]|uniref:BMP family ABC transporter substrate-binding protein n=1 Tax=Lentibacillus sp. CBA3610 TaxID=2518176 RepID=UPI001595E2AA|nr:BMP family ABC transporter substrate-binding protein [Lentibacillus sp. CBA3610]QKY68600.1 BMP family ABC transporter substrate-binding protein [Lentibacillus sp. CBA3610]